MSEAEQTSSEIEEIEIPEPDESRRPPPLNFSESDESSLFNKTEDTTHVSDQSTFEIDKENKVGSGPSRAARLAEIAEEADYHIEKTAWKYRSIKEILNDP
ncbi:Oidioi.mRNA.OKI2018_I69.chr1.g1840.t1.cds [Oikopleura dioica]|uniref:Oidioi.mRNA.OKI2018_I69.chr1.g1840.t1.cds n=1 Tax=Oikopleura dioica TaxID=34765 RepID=A0ABN7SYA5_OIKDI|nr:Oidioi.mRNA.OKI2018_I69.chr1.g1840.t1.cds [Oikopleura dioica]